MMHTASEKLAIIRLVEDSELSVRRTLDEIKVSRTSFYRWYAAYEKGGLDGLSNQGGSRGVTGTGYRTRFAVWSSRARWIGLNCRPESWPGTSPIPTTIFVSESSVYSILKAHDLITSPQFTVMQAADKFQHPTSRAHELWQTDFTYFRVVSWGWYFLSTILDDYSRYIITWCLTMTMATADVTDTLEDALKATGLSEARVRHKPRRLSDNGPCYISGELKSWLKKQEIEHTRGAPYHQQTQGKIERYHRSMKNVVNLEHYYYPWELEQAISKWVEHYNHERYHESLDNVTPADVYEGKRNEILDQRAAVKYRTLTQRKIHNLQLAG